MVSRIKVVMIDTAYFSPTLGESQERCDDAQKRLIFMAMRTWPTAKIITASSDPFEGDWEQYTFGPNEMIEPPDEWYNSKCWDMNMDVSSDPDNKLALIGGGRLRIGIKDEQVFVRWNRKSDTPLDNDDGEKLAELMEKWEAEWHEILKERMHTQIKEIAG